MLIDGNGNELVDLAEIEPWVYGVKFGDKIYPVLKVLYKMHSIEIEYASEDKETLLKKLGYDWDG